MRTPRGHVRGEKRRVSALLDVFSTGDTALECERKLAIPAATTVAKLPIWAESRLSRADMA